MSLVFRSLAFLCALSLMALGGVAMLVYAHGIVDPVSLKMADDGDPFGMPPSRAGLVIGCFVSAAVSAAGAWLALSIFWRRAAPSEPRLSPPSSPLFS